jgi:hypothetical protein
MPLVLSLSTCEAKPCGRAAAAARDVDRSRHARRDTRCRHARPAELILQAARHKRAHRARHPSLNPRYRHLLEAEPVLQATERLRTLAQRTRRHRARHIGQDGALKKGRTGALNA